MGSMVSTLNLLGEESMSEYIPPYSHIIMYRHMSALAAFFEFVVVSIVAKILFFF